MLLDTEATSKRQLQEEPKVIQQILWEVLL
jgi:hypothetical protein